MSDLQKSSEENTPTLEKVSDEQIIKEIGKNDPIYLSDLEGGAKSDSSKEGSTPNSEEDEEESTPDSDEEDEDKSTPASDEEDEEKSTPASDEEDEEKSTPASDEEDKKESTPASDEEDEKESTPASDEEDEKESTPDSNAEGEESSLEEEEDEEEEDEESTQGSGGEEEEEEEEKSSVPLNPYKLKVKELRSELHKRGANTKGLKGALKVRLQNLLNKEKPSLQAQSAADEEDIDEEGDTDTDEEEDENLYKKLDQDIHKELLAAYHPETKQINIDELMALSMVTRNDKGNIIDMLHQTVPFLTKYEYARILGLRTIQINNGSSPFIKVSDDIIDGYTIAKEELLQKKIPYIIRRPLPHGGSEYWKLQDLEIINC